MSVARGNGQNGGHFYSNISQPIKLDIQFTVTPTNGLGVTSVKSNGYARNVFMHTSTTPASNNGALNPNPADGYALIQLNNQYKYFIGSQAAVIAPLAGSDLTATTAGLVYVITALGTASAAQWLAAGVPAGVTPAVGVAFVAIATGTIGGSATVKVPGSSGVSAVEVVAANLVTTSLATYGGSYVMLQFMGASFAGSALAAHTHNFIVKGGQAASTTNNIANYAGPIIGKEEASDATYLGSASAANGGVVAASAGTPAGSMSLAAVAPAVGSIVCVSLYMDISSVTIDGL